jgi:hypothetical protein
VPGFIFFIIIMAEISNDNVARDYNSIPNRYDSQVMVEIIYSDGYVRNRTFADLQTAYLWVQTQAYNNIHPFETVCTNLDIVFARYGYHTYTNIASSLAVQYNVCYKNYN